MGLELFFSVFWVVAWVRMVEGNILFHAVSSALMDFIIFILSELLFCIHTKNEKLRHCRL